MPGSKTIDPLAELRSAVVEVAAELGAEDASGLTLERPPKPELGDYSTNAAMLLGGAMRAAPREVAERLPVAPCTVLRYFEDGVLPGRRLRAGRFHPVRFRWSEIEAALDFEDRDR